MTNCCKYPFERIQIELNGNVFLCCSAYCKKYCIGNIFTDEIDNIWYGKKAIEFRKSVLDKSYKYCDLGVCGNFYEENITQINNIETAITPPYPQIVYFAYSTSCNVKCKICRDELIIETKDETKHLNSIVDKLILLCRNAEIIYLNGGGGNYSLVPTLNS